MKKDNKTYAVMRLPCFMEDGGRTFLEGIKDTKQEAEDLITTLTEDGYFKRGDYKIYRLLTKKNERR